MSIQDRMSASSSHLRRLAEAAVREHAAHSAQEAGRIHELQVQQVELETQNEELRRAEPPGISWTDG